ncbi:hypothetical protein BDW22DRAFT_8307 [Trametopsis cervina]|nr:hypothetical protein BDW22DRAFT_8307 [Trametopsis cervina]
MHLTPAEAVFNTQLSSLPPPMEADMHNYGFPSGYFVIKNVATNRLLDIESGRVDDDTPVILYPETETSLVEDMRRPEADNQVFFIDMNGNLCSRSSGHAIDVSDEKLVIRHRRPVSHPYPNPFSHPLPRFTYDPDTQQISVTFAFDPSYPTSASRAAAFSGWKDKLYFLTAIPMRKPRTLMDNATDLLSTAISVPFSFLGAPSAPSARPDEIFDTGDIDLKEDEILETDRSEEGEVDDSLEKHRPVRVVGLTKEEENVVGEKARARRRWVVTPLRNTRNRTGSRIVENRVRTYQSCAYKPVHGER